MDSITENQNTDIDNMIHILLVDDEYNIVRINKMVLEQMGYTVLSAHSGRQAVSLIEEYGERIDIIVTDYLMPGMNGIELAFEANSYLTDTPIILYTGKAEFIDQNQIAEAGIIKVVLKPYRMKDLDIIIRDILRKS